MNGMSSTKMLFGEAAAAGTFREFSIGDTFICKIFNMKKLHEGKDQSIVERWMYIEKD